ncbi:Uncharacterised protein [Streptococcus pneumoniae]|nr:Uncharacterised protein [Streptococcus pneumoniae]
MKYTVRYYHVQRLQNSSLHLSILKTVSLNLWLYLSYLMNRQLIVSALKLYRLLRKYLSVH